MPEPQIPTPQDDPITSRSFTFPLLISALLLMLTVAWSFYDEVYGLRPWRSYQRRFTTAYSGFLEKTIKQEKQDEAAVYASAEYKSLLGAELGERVTAAEIERIRKVLKARSVVE